MTKEIFFIAGEASGDALGASLLRGIKEHEEGEGIAFSGIGGNLMQAQGLNSLLPMQELCVMGIWEVVWQLPRLLRLVSAVVEEIENRRPDVVVTIDLPDFNFKVAEKLKQRGIYKGKIIHYVAPSVWAWRPGRAQKVAKFLDGMMCTMPFEPKYFEKHKLKSAYVGHPLLEVDQKAIDVEGFRTGRRIPDDEPTFGVFFGSREAEIKTLAPVLLEVVDLLREQHSDMHIIIPTLPEFELDVRNLLQGMQPPIHIVTDQDSKWRTFAACDTAVAVSGTVGLELAYLGVPHVIAYKTHPLTWLVVKLMVKTKYAHLANILLEKGVVPEFLQFKCTSTNIAKEVMRLLKYPESRQEQKEEFEKLDELLRTEINLTPSEQAARFVLEYF